MRLLMFIFFLLASSPVISQQHYVESNINNKCISQPGAFNIEKDLEGTNFKVINLISGTNCYNGLPIKEINFFIKNSLNEIIYSSKSSLKLEKLKLSSGIYKIYLDGGKGAYIKLEYALKLKYP